MKKLTLSLLTSTSILFGAPALAGSSSGPVEALTVNTLSKVFFAAGTRAGAPGCATNPQWALDATTAEGKAMYAMILTAKALEKNVTVTGNNTCSVQPDRETVQFMQVAD